MFCRRCHQRVHQCACSSGPQLKPSDSLSSTGPSGQRALGANRRADSRPRELSDLNIKQAFGTDISKHKSREEKKKIIAQALDAGYRLLDCAALYETFDVVSECLKEKQLVDQTLILYKVKPDEVSAVNKARQKLGRWPDILMLHELADTQTATLAAMTSLSSRIRSGCGRFLGLSNVTSLDELRVLCEAARRNRVPVTYLQNRFSPYYQDTEIRAYCRDQGIVYMAYGLMGSRQLGACHGEGDGLPTLYLLPTLDARLEKLATSLVLQDDQSRGPATTGELLLFWAIVQGVVPVAFSTHAERVRCNLRANELSSSPIFLKMEELFSTPHIERRSVIHGRSPAVKALYHALRDPTAWWLLDELVPVAEPLLTSMVERVGVMKTELLRNMSYNLIRFAADLQSNGMPDWLVSMKEEFRKLSRETQSPRSSDKKKKAYDLCFEWLMKDAMKGGGVKEAPDRPEEILSGTYKPAAPVTTVGRLNNGMSARPVENPEVGMTLSLRPADSSSFYKPDWSSAVNFEDLQAGGEYQCQYSGEHGIYIRILSVAKDCIKAKVIEAP
jgi:diketogulonate reductase-like aldo/keto reductase